MMAVMLLFIGVFPSDPTVRFPMEKKPKLILSIDTFIPFSGMTCEKSELVIIVKRTGLTGMKGLALLGIGAAFVFLKLYGLQPALSDENIYFYDAWLICQGLWPYRDFFFAHPPLHLLPGYLLLLAMGGFHLIPMKLLPVSATAITGFCTYALARRSTGLLAAVLACSLFLFSHDVLRASSHWTGINWAVMFMTGGLLLAWRGRMIAGGILLGLGVCTGFYIAPAALAILMLLLLKNRRDGLRFLLAVSSTWLIVNGACFAMAGMDYIDAVYLYHLRKPPLPGSGLSDNLSPIVFHNFFLMSAPLFFCPLLLLKIWHSRIKTGRIALNELLDPQRHPAISLGIWCITIWMSGAVFLGLLSRVFHFYFLILFPVAAVCAGLGIDGVIRLIRRRKPGPAFAALLAISGIAAGIGFYPRLEHGMDYFVANRGKTITYPKPRLPITFPGGSALTDLLWQSERVIGGRYSGIRYYLWHESRSFDIPAQTADVLKDLAKPDEVIFGDSTATPLVALMAGIPIAERMADTNVMRFRSGLPPIGELIEALETAMDREHERLTWIVVNPNRGIALLPEFQQFLNARFKTVQVFRSRNYGSYFLMHRED